MLTRIPNDRKTLLPASLFSRPAHPPVATSWRIHSIAAILAVVSCQGYATGIADLLNRAQAMRDGGNFAESELLYRQILEEQDARGEGGSHEAVTALAGLGEIFHLTGRDHEAQIALRRLLRIQESTLPPHDAGIAVTLNNLAEVYRSRERNTTADPLYRRALRIFEATLGQDHPWVARVLNNLASLKVNTGSYKEAAELLRRALAVSEKAGAESSQVATILNNLAVCAIEQEKFRDAEPYLVRALRLYGPVPAANEVLEHYAFVLRRTGRAARADQISIRLGGVSGSKAFGDK